MAEQNHLIFAPGYSQGYYVSYPPDISYSYNRLMDVFRRSGFEPHFYQPDWNRHNPDHWAAGMAEEAIRLAQEDDVENVFLAGFSFGALTSVLAAQKLEQSPGVKFGGLVAASLSPFFGETWLRRAYHDPTSGIHTDPVALAHALSELELPELTVPTQLYIGTQEVYRMQAFHDEVRERWPQAVSIRPACAHNVLHPSYLQAISANVAKLAVKA